METWRSAKETQLPGFHWLRAVRPIGSATTLQRTIHGHSDTVNDIAWSPDGIRLASGSDDQTVRIWEASSGLELMSLKATGAVTELEFSCDGSRLFAACGEVVRVWNPHNGVELEALEGHSSDITALCLSRDATRLVTIASEAAKIWDVPSGEELASLPEEEDIDFERAAIRPDGARFVTTGVSSGALRMWDSDGQAVACFAGHVDDPGGAAWSSDGRLVAVSADNYIIIWDSDTGGLRKCLHHEDLQSSCLAFTKDDRQLVVWNDLEDRLCLVDCDAGSEQLALKGHSGEVTCMAVLKKKRRMITGSDDNSVAVWDLKKGREMFRLLGHSDSVNALAVSADEKLVASASDDGQVRVWNLKKEKEVQSLGHDEEQVKDVSFSPDGQFIATASGDKQLRVWRLESGEVVWERTLEDVACVDWSPDQKFLVAGTKGGIVVHDGATKEELHCLTAYEDIVQQVTFSPDGALLLTRAEYDRHVKLWETATWTESRDLCGHRDSVTAVAYSPHRQRTRDGF